jgi:hypothetical protein
LHSRWGKAGVRFFVLGPPRWPDHGGGLFHSPRHLHLSRSPAPERKLLPVGRVAELHLNLKRSPRVTAQGSRWPWRCRPGGAPALLPGVANVRCRLGTSVTSLEQDACVSVAFSDGSTGDYDLVVGSDGIKSTIRVLTLTTTEPSDLGAMNWRSIAPTRPRGLNALQLHLGDGCVFGLVPMGPGAPTVSP